MSFVHEMEKCVPADRAGAGFEAGSLAKASVCFSCSTLVLLMKRLGWEES